MLRMKLDDVVDAAPMSKTAESVCGIAGDGALMGKREYLMDTYTENYKGCGAFYGCANAGHVFGAALIYVVVLISWTTAIILPTLLVLKRFNRGRVSVETVRPHSTYPSTEERRTQSFRRQYLNIRMRAGQRNRWRCAFAPEMPRASP